MQNVSKINMSPNLLQIAQISQEDSTHHLLTKSTNSAEKYSAGSDGAA